jgi:putative SOS response-associated peptidase YedK
LRWPGCVWDSSRALDGSITHSFAIITLPASPLMAQIHNAGKREPAILSREDWILWLSGTPEQARGALRQYPDDLLLAYAVSKRVNSPKNNDAQLIEPLPELPRTSRAI